MVRIVFRSLALILATLVVVLAYPETTPSADPPSKDQLGKKIGNFTLKDAAGKAISLHGLRDQKAIVVVFLSFDCPNSTNYSPTLIELHKQYAGRGVAFLGVCPCDDDDAAVARHAREFAIPFPVVKDQQFAATDALLAKITPEAFLLDGDFVVRYRGRIDNTFAARLKKNAATTRHDLKAAIDDLLAGRPVSEPVTEAVGCLIYRPDSSRPADGKVTYYRDALPVLQAHCQGCHRPGEVGPFSLMTYRQAVNWAADIKDYTKKKLMPPWKATEGPAFLNDRRMPDRDIATLAAWVDSGCPEGDPKDAPPPRQFPRGWQMGEPDLVLSVDKDFQLAGSGRDVFRCFVLPTNLTEDKYIRAIEVRPGNPRIVHHTLNFIDTSGRARQLEDAEQKRPNNPAVLDGGPGYSMSMGVGFIPSGAIGGWAPGQQPYVLPKDSYWLLPKGSDVVIQVHYHRNGRIEKDRTQIGLYFSKERPAKRLEALVLPGRFLFIPAGIEDFPVTGSIVVDQDCDLHSIMPHMHLLGKSIRVTMTPPGREAVPLINVPDWDYNWQETYFFKQPLRIKSGTRFDVEAHFDNSARNPLNPNTPPRLVRFGEQTTDEMCFVFFSATSDTPGRIRFRMNLLGN
jgi:peroxiredoxin/mono/diheme cytochrome c family protein